MNRYDCEAIRDLLPSLMRGEMLPHEAALAELHLDACADCRTEADIVQLLQENLAVLPSGLETRVLAAVRRRSVMRGLPARLAMAAALAVAVIGGSLVFDSSGSDTDLDIYAVSWAAAEDPLLHGSSELQDLSIEELEVLLEVME